MAWRISSENKWPSICGDIGENAFGSCQRLKTYHLACRNGGVNRESNRRNHLAESGGGSGAAEIMAGVWRNVGLK